MFLKNYKYKDFNLNIFLLFSFIAIALRVWISQFGSNFDFGQWQNNLELFKQGKSIYEFGNYTYSTPWIYTLYFLDTISFSLIEKNSFIKSIPGTFYRFKIVVFLSLVDVYIFYLLYKNYSLKIGLLYLINPISIILTGHHNAFENYAILFGFLSILMYGNFNVKEISYKKIFSLLLLGFSISIKHILLFLPLWLAFKEKKMINKLLILIIPYTFFIITFTPFLPEDFYNIIYKILYFGAHETGPFWKIFLPAIFDKYFSFHTLFSLLMIIMGFCLVNKNLKDTFFLYLIAVVAFAPQIYTQYLLIPLIAIVVYWNVKFTIYTSLATLLFLIDGDQLNIQYLREILNWDLRSTRIAYYPLVFILILFFFEKTTKYKKIYLVVIKILKLFLYKVKLSLSFKK
ncbi:hypothetical protein N9341_01030 [Candidatus Pelagibacter sp.]|nr:hypothetical protein [Candidatus Pelagibacter sp.]